MDIEINTVALRNDAKQMSDEVMQLRETMVRMNESIGALNSMWEGSSHTALLNQYATDYENMMEVCNTVDRIIECMMFAVGQYNQCDDEVRNAINSIKI